MGVAPTVHTGAAELLLEIIGPLDFNALEHAHLGVPWRVWPAVASIGDFVLGVFVPGADAALEAKARELVLKLERSGWHVLGASWANRPQARNPLLRAPENHREARETQAAQSFKENLT
jgi:hypothetical protein